MSPATSTRMTADERRSDVMRAAMTEFALGGYAGTSIQAIANRVGVSQPYLFQLYRTKKDLFLAVVRECFARTRIAFEESAMAARRATDGPDEILHAMGMRYVDMLRDRQMLRLQLHAYAACEDPDIRAAVREEWTALYGAVARASGADERALHAWFAEGMLLNVAASIGDLDQAVALKLASAGGADGAA